MKKILMTIFAGVSVGVMNAILMLYMMISSGFTVFSIAFYISLAVAIALPQCLNVAKKLPIHLGMTKVIMILTSYVITLLYGNAVNSASELVLQYSNLATQVFLVSSILHGCALLSVGVFALAAYGKKWKEAHLKH